MEKSWEDRVRATGFRNDLPSLFHVVLVEPEIPQNTGNIGRSCVHAASELHLVEPLGFEISDAQLKRAGLDYWPFLRMHRYPNLHDWSDSLTPSFQPRTFYFSAKAKRHFTDQEFQLGDRFVFGCETKGLPESLLTTNAERCLAIPVLGPARGLNLATAVAVVLFEGVRQLQMRKELAPEYLQIPWGEV